MGELETPSVTEQKNMVLGGTYIIQGQGRAVVVRTGEQLQMNRPNQKSNPELESEAEVSGSILTKNLSWLGFLLLVATLIIYWSLGRWRQLSLSTGKKDKKKKKKKKKTKEGEKKKKKKKKS